MMFDIPLKQINGEATTLSELGGTCWLIVNVASECGLTKQYTGLQELNDRYNEYGLEICGFPCNQFGMQEPGNNEEISQFCTTEYGVTFNLMDKCEVNGENRHSLYEILIGDGEDISWNFEKFLVTSNGVVKRFPPKVEPNDPALIKAIEDETSRTN